MNSNILKENMKRFGTKNLSEQEEVPTDAAPEVNPNEKPKGKVMAAKTYTFNGFQGKDRKGRDIDNPGYSIDFELINEPQIGPDGKVESSSKKVMADGKIILALSTQGTVYQDFPSNYPRAMQGAGSDRVSKWLMGMLAMEGKMDYSRLKKSFAEKKLIKSFQGPTGMDLYQNKYPSKYYSYS